jgi:hypothetical protein
VARAFIPAKLDDNPHLDRDAYERTLRDLPEVLVQQLLDGDWGAFEGAAYPALDKTVHVVPAFYPPESWERWEAMDYGVSSPTSWGLFAADYDGNTVVLDEHYAPGLADVHATEVLARRESWWERKDGGYPVRHVCYGDPASIRESQQTRDKLGDPMTLQDVYQELGVRIVAGNNKRQAGMARIAELLRPIAGRPFPGWHSRYGETGSPKLFVVGSRCPNVLDQLGSAPIAKEENDPERGKAVDRRWERAYGHAHAMLRYGLLSRDRKSKEPEQEPDDPRVAILQRVEKRIREGWAEEAYE